MAQTLFVCAIASIVSFAYPLAKFSALSAVNPRVSVATLATVAVNVVSDVAR